MPAGKGRGECVIYHLAKNAAFTQRSERLELDELVPIGREQTIMEPAGYQ
jgi:hypothetical protein